jgi:tetratricopeptide (TPR) repeat protein
MSTRPHAFVAMPFGTKPGPDGRPIDFNRVFTEYIAPALEAAGLTAFRADQERRAGDIRTDMFQELLIADLVVADLSVDNPNVWYELGVRHALRARGVVLVCGGQVTTAFDLYTDRKLRYGIRDGGPDPDTIEADKQQLVEMIKATMESWHGRKVSPVYHLMPNLQEPDWRSLRVGDVREFWEMHEQWETRLDLARRAGRIGDVLVLAEEAPVAAFRAEAWVKAGESLRKAERFGLALEHLEEGLAIDPDNLRALREKGICLQRLALSGAAGHSLDRTREHYRDVLKTHPTDTETWALLGRVDKDAWMAAWNRLDSTPERRREDAAYEDALLRAAIDSYARAFRAHPGHYYSGINALTLMHLARHLTGDTRYDRDMDFMAGAVRFAAEYETDENQLFYAKATLGDLLTLIGTPAMATDAYKTAIAKNAGDWFALRSCRAQLQILHDLGFQRANVEAGLATFERALERLSPPDTRWEPRLVLLFSGHMVDAPDRKEARFPADKEPIAAASIARALDEMGADARDMAYCQAAAGGDLLFLEACQQRGVRCNVLLPFEEPEFIERSVTSSADGKKWCDRFYAVKEKLLVPMRIMPDELGPLPKAANAFERCNLWLLYSALAGGIPKVRFLTLWNGGGGDAPGGTAHMYNEVKRRTGRVTWLDTRELW